MHLPVSARYTTTIPVGPMDNRHFLAIAARTIELLGWRPGAFAANMITAYTAVTLNASQLTVYLEGEQLHISCKKVSARITGRGANRQHAERFIETFRQLQQGWPQEELELAAAQFSGHEESVPYEKEAGFFSLFIPRGDFFVTPILIHLNIIMFIIMAISGVGILDPDSEQLLKWGADFRPSTLDGEWWRIITSMFLHAGIIHLLFNMYALMYIGALLEPLLGRLRFIAAYMFTGVISSLASLYFHPMTVSVGASGAIFGMYGVFLAMLTTNIIEKSARQAMLANIGVFVAYNLIYGFAGNTNVDNAAHVGGLIGGIITGYLFYPTIQFGNERKGQLIIIALLAVLGTGATIFILKNLHNDYKIYSDAMTAFDKYETTALGVYDRPDTTSKESYLAQISDSGIHVWEKDMDMLESLQSLDLPQAVKSRNEKLKAYVQLRKESYDMIYKRVAADGSTTYDSLIAVYDQKIDSVVKELNKD